MINTFSFGECKETKEDSEEYRIPRSKGTIRETLEGVQRYAVRVLIEDNYDENDLRRLISGLEILLEEAKRK